MTYRFRSILERGHRQIEMYCQNVYYDSCLPNFVTFWVKYRIDRLFIEDKVRKDIFIMCFKCLMMFFLKVIFISKCLI